MATSILIIGESGTGKSTSIRNLDPKETCIINILGKPLPFKGWSKMYNEENQNLYHPQTKGNEQFDTRGLASMVRDALVKISKDRPEVKTIILDDYHYVMAFEFMQRAMEKGYDKFTEIATHTGNVLKCVNFELRKDLNVVFMWHPEKDNEGNVTCKTVGKFVSEKLGIEGLFTYAFHTIVKEGEYLFLTNKVGGYLAKTSMGMFEEKLIPNDLALVIKAVDDYANEDVKV